MKFGHYGIVIVSKVFNEDEILNTLKNSGIRVKDKIVNQKPFVYLTRFTADNCYLCQSEKHFRLLEWAEAYPFYEVYFHNTEKEVVLSHVREKKADPDFKQFYKCESCKDIADLCNKRSWRDFYNGYGYNKCLSYEYSFISRFKFLNKIRIWMATHNIFGEEL